MVSAVTTTSVGLDRFRAEQWSECFRALGDPTRVLILHLLATSDRPLTVGELTDRLDVGQSTVSHHLARLAEVRFVEVERVATSSRWRVNPECISGVPSAAEIILGRGSIADREVSRS